MVSLNFSQIMDSLLPELGDVGLEYLLPQMEIIRLARALPKDIEDERLIASQFFEALTLIETWIEPLSFIMLEEVGPLEEELQTLQRQTRFLLEESNTVSWYDALNHSNPRIPTLLKEIEELKNLVLEKRNQILTEGCKNKIVDLLGLVLYPYSPQIKSLSEATKLASKTYYGANILYKKSNKYTDALIFVTAARKVLSKSREEVKGEVVDYEDIFKVAGSDPEIEEIEYLYKQTKSAGFTSNGLNMRQINYLVSRVLNRPSLNFMERSKFNREFYLADIDRYQMDKTFQWMSNEYYGVGKSAAKPKIDRSKDDITAKKYLFGLSFLDKHKNQEVIGNIPKTAFSHIDAVLSIFHELKQSGNFMEAAQFELTTQVYGLPEQAWLYDFTGIKSEILRSTMLLLSDRIPKFDLLESCQRLATAVLSGRVDRNDLRIRQSGGFNNFIETKLLPEHSWNFIADSLVEMLEEVMVREEERSSKIVRQIFSEEDRSDLVISKKFNPVSFVNLSFKKSGLQKHFSPQSITIFARKDFEFQYRHAQASGYPWYIDENQLFQILVVQAMEDKSLPEDIFHLRKVISNIDGEKFIFYYEAKKISDSEFSLNCLAFKEVPEFEEGITPVEVLFRPKKFMSRKPKDNNLWLLVENARASDPKDLEALIGNL